MQEDKLTLSDIRKDLDRRMKAVMDLKARLAKLGEEIMGLLGDIDGLEGVGPQPKRKARRKTMALADAIGGADPDGEDGAEDADEGIPQEQYTGSLEPAFTGFETSAEPAAKPRKKPAPRRREGPSLVDVAEEILKELGRPVGHEELARLVEAKGVSSGNTQQVLLLAAGRKTRLVKNQDGLIALPGAPRPEAEPAPAEAAPPPPAE